MESVQAMKQLLLVLDLDDTLADTHGYIFKELVKFFTAKGMTEELEYIRSVEGTISSMSYRKDISAHTYKQVIEPGHYMRDADPTQLIHMGLIELLRSLKKEFGELLTIVVCTHRGFHKDGKSSSREWIIQHRMNDVVECLYAIDSKDHPNKITFLKELYPEHSILLLDDNPFHDGITEHEHSPEVLVYSAITDLPGYANQDKFTSIGELSDRIKNLINNN